MGGWEKGREGGGEGVWIENSTATPIPCQLHDTVIYVRLSIEHWRVAMVTH